MMTSDRNAADPLLSIEPLGFPWATVDPFLFCVYHDDAYPRGNAQMGPAASLAGRSIGQDFSRKEGWSMYHGTQVPGFPAHPHRGFETVTIVRKGLIDHSDSLGAVARFGQGDVQWLTAGAGIVHSEMFPLLDQHNPNPLELFQIWLNLPASRKMAAPYFTMFWGQDIPRLNVIDDQGRSTQLAVIAGPIPGASDPLAPPPDSWASQPDADVAIWTIRMEAGAVYSLPAAAPGVRRRLYWFKGRSLALGGRQVGQHAVIEVRPDADVELTNGSDAGELLMLQGRPIGEPVAQYGPFVMNTKTEIAAAMDDYRRTQFGGWPWSDDAPVHGADPARFARVK